MAGLCLAFAQPACQRHDLDQNCPRLFSIGATSDLDEAQVAWREKDLNDC